MTRSADTSSSAAERHCPAQTPDQALRANHTIVLYDGVCHFCDSTVQFLLRKDKKERFLFSPLQSDATRYLRQRYSIPEQLDTIAVIDNDEIYVRTDALLRVAWRLGGAWSLFIVFWLIPRFLRDAAYNLFARFRYRMFGKRDVCAMPTPEQEARFLVPPTALEQNVSLEVHSHNKLRDRGSSIRKRLPSGLRLRLEAYRSGQRITRPWSTIFYILDVIRAVLFQFERWRVGQRAAGVAFFILIGFVPSVMMLVVATEMLGLTDAIGEFVIDAIITNYIPIERSKALETLSLWVANARTTIAGGIGFLAMSFAALNAFSGLYALINDLWQVPVRGRLAHKMGAAFTSLLFVPAALFLSTWLTTRFGGMRIIGPYASRIIAYLLIFVIALIGLKVIARAKVRWQSALIAAAFGAFAFEVAKTVFAIYVREMLQGSWFAIYGAIFLFPVFLLWNLVAANIAAATASLGWVIQNPGEAFYDAGIASPYSMDLDEPRTRSYDPATGAFALSISQPSLNVEDFDLYGVYEPESLRDDLASENSRTPLD